jgi:diadenosine tetraphosphate (Ap4A) HIT family hydrolase
MWREPARWRELTSESSCPICQRGRPADVLAELQTSWATGGPDAPLPGYVCIVAKRHVVEPWELPDSERSAFWEDAVAAGRAVASAVDATKMNYEIHGNTIPHLHMHLFPRFRGDPYEGRALDGHARFQRSPQELERLAEALSSCGRAAGGRA